MEPQKRPNHRRILDLGKAVVALVAFLGVFYLLVRVTRIINPLPCLVEDLYGGASAPCKAAMKAGRADPWAPYVLGAFCLYIAGSIGYLLYGFVRSRDLKAVGLIVLWILGIFVIWRLR